MFFRDRADAGKQLAQVFLASGRDFSGWSVVGIARGGVIVGAQVAASLRLPLQSFLVDDIRVDDETLVVATPFDRGGIFKKNYPPRFIADLSSALEDRFERELADFRERQARYNYGRNFVVPKRVILCDDGVVTGRSARVAAEVLRRSGTEEIILGIPAIPPTFAHQDHGFEVVTWRVSKNDAPTGMFYFNFPDASDEEVVSSVRAFSTEGAS